MVRAARKTDQRRFYADALSEAERAGLSEALEVEGFDAEIAALRLRLKSRLKRHPEDLALVIRGMDVLRRLVAAKYGLSREDQSNLGAFAAETLLRMKERAEDGSDHDDG